MRATEPRAQVWLNGNVSGIYGIIVTIRCSFSLQLSEFFERKRKKTLLTVGLNDGSAVAAYIKYA